MPIDDATPHAMIGTRSATHTSFVLHAGVPILDMRPARLWPAKRLFQSKCGWS